VRRYRYMAEAARQSEQDLWQAAGITPGATVADIGCGPPPPPVDGFVAPSPDTGRRQSRSEAGPPNSAPSTPDPGVFFLHQPLPNPTGGMPLLLRRRHVLNQPPPNKINIRAGRRSRPLRHLPSRRCGIRQRLTHRPPVHPMTLRQRPNRHPPIAGINVGYLQTAPLSISPSHPGPFVIALTDDPKVVEGND